MTRWAMAVDLNRCVGCQTCTSACKHANATAPGVQWRKVLDFEVGEFPDVHRAFMPVGCMHCEDPPCLEVCPSTATKKRDDGIVTIDYDLCIGCAYCAVACPYQARWRVDIPNAAFGGPSMRHEKISEHEERRGVAQKCTFCIDRIDHGLENGLTPGVDPHATPACVNSCIADALHFGDIDDPDSNVSGLVAGHKHYRMHDEIGTGPALYYLWDRGAATDTPIQPAPMVAEPVGLKSVAPKLQASWDWRAAANFIAGGTGTGLFTITALVAFFAAPLLPAVLVALALVATGLFCVWLEIGRPWRFINVLFNARQSWMTREAIAGIAFFALAALALLFSSPLAWLAAAAAALTFLYCQAKILHAAKGIPAWRQAEIVPLIIATGVTEGLGLFAVIAFFSELNQPLLKTLTLVLVAMLLIREVFWHHYRKRLGRIGAPSKTFAAFDSQLLKISSPTQLVILVIVAAGLVVPVLLVPGGILALLSGWAFKYTLITKAAYNQGYAIERMPVRGVGKGAPGIKPGWTLS